MAEIIKKLIDLDKQEEQTSDPNKLRTIRLERVRLVEEAYSGAYEEE